MFQLFTIRHVGGRISKAELDYLTSQDTAPAPDRAGSGLRVPWRAMVRSRAVHVLWFTHLCSAFGFYLLSLNLSLFIREALGFAVTDVTTHRTHLGDCITYHCSPLSERDVVHASNPRHAAALLRGEAV